MKNDCCLIARKYARLKQDFQHFIQLDQLNLERRRRTNLDETERQTNLVKLFAKIHLNRHFYTNSSICELKELKDRSITRLRLPVNNEECNDEFINCCLDEQLQIATGIDLALRSRFKQTKILNDQISNENQTDNYEIEYRISSGEKIKTNCILLTNKTNRLNEEDISDLNKSEMLSIYAKPIGLNIAFDSCEACCYGIELNDQFENCNLIENRDQLFSIITRQCCRIIHLSRLAEHKGLIKIKKNK